GSYPAFRTSVRIVILSIRRDGFPAFTNHTTPPERQNVRRNQKRRRLLQTAPFAHDKLSACASLRAMPKDVTTECIHGADARYSFHRLLPSVRRRVQANPSHRRITKRRVNTRVRVDVGREGRTPQPALAASQE